MVRTFTVNQLKKIDRPQIQPIYLVHVSTYGGDTLYLSDRNYNYNSNTYEAYLFELPALRSVIANLGGYDNSQFTLTFNNSAFRDHDHLIQFFDDYPIEGQYVEIYKLLIDTGETFDSDVSTKIFKGVMEQPYDITETSFNVDCSCMLFAKDKSLPLDTIDSADFPLADPDDIGKHRNIVYGNVEKLVCPWTVAGWVSTLTADISSSTTSIVVTDAAASLATPFTMICDNEQIRVTGKSANTLTVTRGYGGTTALAHNRGATVYEQRSDFEAEVAQHPVKSIGDVYVKRGVDEWLRVVSGVTKYTDSAGRAKLVFSDKIKYEEKTNQVSSLETEPHDHTISGMQLSQKTCLPTGGPTEIRDGNIATYHPLPSGNTVEATFTESNLGTINKQIIMIHKNDTGSAITVACGGVGLGSFGAGVSGWLRIVKTGGAWADSIVIQGGAGGNQIGEVEKTVEYTPTAPIASYKDLTPSLIGNSVANMVIEDIVAANVEGYQDDGSGTYTGTPDALIERPDHVRKHILIALLGFSSGDIDASFGTVGTIYAERISGGYKLSFVLHDVATKAMELFRQIDMQTRSHMFESEGLFKLSFCSPDEPTSQFVFNSNNVKGEFVFSKTETADIRNKVRAHFFRDYTKLGDLSIKYRQVGEQSDSSSISKYGLMARDIEFNLVGDNSDMVYDVISWILSESRETKRVVKFTAFWDASILEQCEYFTVNSSFWDGYKFKLLGMQERPEIQGIDMSGLEFAESDIDGGGLIYRGLIVNDDEAFVQAIHRVGSQTYAGMHTQGVYNYLGNGNWNRVDERLPVRCLLEFNDYLYCGTYRLFVGGSGIVYKLESGSWSSIGSPGSCKAVYSMVEFDSKIYAGTWDEGKIFRLDAGPSWTDVGRPGSESSILSLVVVGSTLYCAGHTGYVYCYDGGTTWTSIGWGGARLATNDGKLYGTLYSAPNYLAAEYVSGTTWTTIGTISDGAYTRPEICAFNNKIYWGVSIWDTPPCGKLYEYSGVVESWNLMATIFDTELYSLFSSSSAIWIGTDDGRIFSWS